MCDPEKNVDESDNIADPSLMSNNERIEDDNRIENWLDEFDIFNSSYP